MKPRSRAPGPRSCFGVTEALAFRKDSLHYLQNLASNYGDIVHFRLGWKHAFLLNHPGLVQEFLVVHASKHVRGPIMQRGRAVMGEGLLTSEDPLHATQRRLVQPAFHRERIARYGQVMVECTLRACKRWSPDQPIDLREEMMALTLGILGKTLFDREMQHDSGDIGKAVTELMSLVDLVFVPFSKHLVNLPIPGMRRLKRVRERLDRLIYGLIEERVKSGAKGDDLISLLLQSHPGGSGNSNSIQQIRDECLTILLAGHETIANALTYSLLLLAQHPAEARQVGNEVEEVAGCRNLRSSDYDRLLFTRSALSEAMRLYPPVWLLGRAITAPCRIGEFTAPAGSILFASQYLLHRDARFFPEPNLFKPERFLPHNKINTFAYFPFGIGPRRCIGESFALMEGTLALGTILRHWQPELLPNTELVLDPKITLRPKVPVLIRMRPINLDFTRPVTGDPTRIECGTTTRQAAVQ